MSLKAVIFDVDGTIAETERDGHRIAFNRAFECYGLKIHWDENLYADLLKTAGGRERLKYYFEAYHSLTTSYPQKTINELHELKNQAFQEIINNGEIQPRPGIIRIMDEIQQAGIMLSIATTGSRIWVEPLLEKMLGAERFSHLKLIVTGDDVTDKKPHPQAYEVVLSKLGVASAEALAIEDSRNGLLAAVRANIPCLFTPSSYTHDDECSEVVLAVSNLGDLSIPIRILSNPLALDVGELVDISVLQKINTAVQNTN